MTHDLDESLTKEKLACELARRQAEETRWTREHIVEGLVIVYIVAVFLWIVVLGGG